MRPGPAGDMETSVILLVILGAISGLCYGDGLLPDSLNAAVGGKVTFTTTVTPPETPFLSVSWSFTDIRGSSNIITSSNMDITGPAYTDRITFFRSNGSLELWNLTPSDSGEYSILISNGAGMQNGKCILVIDAPVSNVVVTISNTDLSELSSSVSLSCSSSGSFLSFLWLNGSSEVTTSDRVQLTDGNSTLTVANVTRYDQGPFRCHVFNNFSNDTSDPVKLDISYGPENINLTISPSQEYFEEGSNISMMCSADSRPPALFQWFLNGDLLSNTGPELSLMNIQMNQSGRYSCLAFNNKTLRNQTSQPATVSVPTPVSNVVVASNNTDLMEFSSSVSLSCSVSSGSFLSFLWLNSSSEVTESERVRLTDGGATLTIINVTRYDQGPFRCRVSNGATIETSQPVNLFIQFGPDNMAIKAPKTVGVGYYTMLYCSTMSVPAPTFTWLYDGKPTSMQDSVYIIPSTRSFDGGTYTCTAVNAVTGLSQTVSHKLTVGDFSDCDCSVAAGRATMLTFVCLLIAIVCGAIACCMIRRNRVKRKCAARQKESVTENRSDM